LNFHLKKQQNNNSQRRGIKKIPQRKATRKEGRGKRGKRRRWKALRKGVHKEKH